MENFQAYSTSFFVTFTDPATIPVEGYFITEELIALRENSNPNFTEAVVDRYVLDFGEEEDEYKPQASYTLGQLIDAQNDDFTIDVFSSDTNFIEAGLDENNFLTFDVDLG